MNINDDIVLTLSINEASDLYDALFHCLRISADKNCEKDVSDSLESVFNKLKEASKGHFLYKIPNMQLSNQPCMRCSSSNSACQIS